MFLLPVLGAPFAVLNYQRLRDTPGAWRAAAMFVLPTLAMVFLRPHTPAEYWLFMAARVGLAAIAYRDQRALVRPHFAAGGRKARWLLAWLVMLLGVLAYMVLVGGTALTLRGLGVLRP
jgi:hypothetical protein